MPGLVEDFAGLFRGRFDAYGTGRGEWIREEVSTGLYRAHLDGTGPGLGIAPLLDDGTCWFAVVDLDMPDFDAARRVQSFLTFSATWLERSRSGNAHVWVFFSEPIEAWVARGMLKYAIDAAGLPPQVEVFPKQDRLREGMLGNYVNLPYFGDTRPILREEPLPVEQHWHPDRQEAAIREAREYTAAEFVEEAAANLNDPDDWRKRARWLLIDPPEVRAREQRQFGQGKELHMCAEYILKNRHSHPVAEGHRNVVYFALAKMLSNYEGFDHDEAWDLMRLVRDAADEEGVEHTTDYELHRILRNAEEGQFTSTGCDDPLMQPYVHPDCPIARNA